MVAAISFKLSPVQSGLLFPILGAGGKVLITRFTVAALEVPQAAVVAVTLYMPALESFTLFIIGLASEELKFLGPVQVNCAPETPLALNCKFCPGHNGPLLLANGVGVFEVMATMVLAADDGHPLTVAITLYVPPSIKLNPVRVGFCILAVNPFGPLQL
jgi:hypothetical protein